MIYPTSLKTARALYKKNKFNNVVTSSFSSSHRPKYETTLSWSIQHNIIVYLHTNASVISL